MTTRLPAVDGWFTLDDEPCLLGRRCPACATYAFPPLVERCPNPECSSDTLDTVPLSRNGKVWSYTVNHYAPPAPYVAPDPFVPYGVAAVELRDEGLVVLGQVVADDVADLTTGADVELVVDTLFTDDEGEHMVWKWRLIR